ncbi:avirulence protein [Sphingomonas sp. Leaf412]|nr:avirulence protein [Sphingomonas sp. Leaf412]
MPRANPTPTPASISTVAQVCAAGTWTVVAPDPNDQTNAALPLQYQSTHFAFRYNSGTTTLSTVQAAATHLEAVWEHYMGNIGFPEPYCASSAKKKANVYVGVGYGLSGGIDGQGNMGMWLGPGGLQDRFGLAHEFGHALQGSTGSLQNSPFAGWLWESHANWMALQLPEFHRSIVHCAAMSVNNPHLYLGSTRMRYCNWQWMENLKNQYGYGIINDIWRNAPKAGDPAQATGDPFTTLLANRGWTIGQLNDEFGRFALRNVNWDYTNPDGTDQGAFYRAQFGNNDPDTNERILRTTTLDPMNLAQRRFSVQPYQAPQRWGYNLVRVHPDAGATSITVDFRGVTQAAPATNSFPGMENEPSTVPAPNSGWRWGLVAINGAGVSRYSALQSASSGSVTMPVSSTDQAVYMVVMGAPSVMTQIRWDQPWYSLYRYPWMVQFTNAMPAGYQQGAPAPIPGGHQHSNGGGWIANGVTVPATAYVGPYARVYGGTIAGNARVEDHAVVLSGTVQDNAVIGGLTVIRGNTILKDAARAFTSFFGLGFLEQNIVLSGNAQNIGDVEQRGASFSTGAYYGFVDQAAATNPQRGSNRTTPVPEVTAAPNYTWY